MDVFALGVVLFELLTGQRPFSGTFSGTGTSDRGDPSHLGSGPAVHPATRHLLQAVRECHPPLPRELNARIPGPLQAICLKALEKAPADRYSSARFFGLDLDRFFRGEAVVADPRRLSQVLEHGVDRHLADLERWQADRLVSTRERDNLVGKYDRLRQREEFWVLDSRRISTSQVILHLGAWSCIVSAVLMFCFGWKELSPVLRAGLPVTLFTALTASGLVLWQRRTRRVALVLLMAGCLIWPLLTATIMFTLDWLPPDDRSVEAVAGERATIGSAEQDDGTPPQPARDLIEGFMSNDQLMVGAATWFLVSILFWRRTRTAGFSLIAGISALVLATSLFAFLDLRDLWEQQRFDVVATWYLAPASVILGWAILLDLRWRSGALSAPLYAVSITVLLLALTCLALEGEWAEWLGVEASSAGSIDRIAYSLITNGGLYLLGGVLAERSRRSRWLRRIATLLFWLTPTHLMAPIAYFVLKEKWAWDLLPAGWTLSELILPLAALVFVFASVPKQIVSPSR